MREALFPRRWMEKNVRKVLFNDVKSELFLFKYLFCKRKYIHLLQG